MKKAPGSPFANTFQRKTECLPACSAARWSLGAAPRSANNWADLFAKVGSFYPLRENFRLTPEVKQKFTEKLRRDPSEFLGIKIASVVRTDGLKLVLADGSWVCYRLSGTEPVVRVYSEARSREDLAKLSAAAKAWIFD